MHPSWPESVHSSNVFSIFKHPQIQISKKLFSKCMNVNIILPGYVCVRFIQNVTVGSPTVTEISNVAKQSQFECIFHYQASTNSPDVWMSTGILHDVCVSFGQNVTVGSPTVIEISNVAKQYTTEQKPLTLLTFFVWNKKILVHHFTKTK